MFCSLPQTSPFKSHFWPLTSLACQSGPPSFPPPPLFSCPVLLSSDAVTFSKRFRWLIHVKYASGLPQWDVLRQQAALRCWRVRSEWSRQLPSTSVFSLVLSESAAAHCSVPGVPLPSPTLCLTLIPILSAQMLTFSSTGTQSTRHSSCLMPKQMTNHVRIWAFSLPLNKTSNLSLESHFT